jgi:hypothetical protein
MNGEEVWVAMTWEAHGEGMGVQGIYSSREAAWEGLKGEVDTLYVDGDGFVRGKPRDESGSRGYFDRRWASAEPVKVRGRAEPQAKPTGP